MRKVAAITAFNIEQYAYMVKRMQSMYHGTLVAQGGKVIDTWPRHPANDARFGAFINQTEFADRLFVTTKIDRTGKTRASRSFARRTRTTDARSSTSLRSSA